MLFVGKVRLWWISYGEIVLCNYLNEKVKFVWLNYNINYFILLKDINDWLKKNFLLILILKIWLCDYNLLWWIDRFEGGIG